VLLDDAAGRREAVSLGFRITGTIGVLRLAAERRLIDVPTVLARLRSSGFYIHDDVIRAAFENWL
jgi:predicted nucleic acid-binding protein